MTVDRTQHTRRTERDGTRRRDATAFRLVVTEGAERGRDLWIQESSAGAMRIGSSRACELVLSDRKVSRRHAAVEWVDGRLRLADLRSMNGTTLNGIAVEAAFLDGGEVIRVGDVLITAESHLDADATRLPAVQGFGRLVGASLAMRRLYPVVERLATADVPVIVEGEAGTGKELLAEVLHESGPRRTASFVVVDARSFDADAIENVLFGPGGAIESAHAGTLFIDDIAEVPPTVQSRLIRVLDRGPRGTSAAHVDVRVIVGTRRDLDREVEIGNFREDLFHRLAVCRIELPPLRAREDDVALLVAHYWRQLDRTGAPPPADLHFDEGHRWPGNVRELKNLVTQRFVLGSPLPEIERGLERADPREAILESIIEKDLSFAEAKERLVNAFEQLYVKRVLDRNHGNVSRAAAVSGLARRYFHRLKARHIK